MRSLVSLFGFLALSTATLDAQQYNLPDGDCPNCRRIDWQNNVALVGGIPKYTQGMNAVTQAGADNTGSSNTQSAINSALSSIGTGQYVYLPAGTYMTSGTINVPRNKALVGAGMGQTIIRYTGGGVPVNFATGSDGWSSDRDMNPVTKGDTQIVASNSSGLSVGDVITIHAGEDNVIVDKDGKNSCDWCGDEDDNYIGQFVEVTAINGNTISINRPAYYDYTVRPGFRLYNMSAGMGLENLKIQCTSNGDSKVGMVEMDNVQKSWLKNVEIEKSHGMFVWIELCYAITVTGCYLHEANDYGSDRAYGLWVFGFNSDHYFYDNIMDWCRYGVNFEGGGAGCIIAYNYIKNVREGDYPPWLHAGIGFHGVHPFQNLMEGNMMPSIIADNTMGSSAHNVAFRNYIARDSYIDWNITDGNWCVDTEINSVYYSFVGNVLGYQGMSGVYERNSCNGGDAVWRWGCVTPGGSSHNDDAFNTALRHGNYDYVTNSVADWISGQPQNLPASFYLSSRPSWWDNQGAGRPWPPIGPDVPGMVNDIPAKDRFEGESSSNDGVAPAAPDGLRVIND